MRAIAIDFETANERRTSPCAVGLAWIEDGVVTRRAYALVRPPEMRFSAHNIRIHGIRPADVEDAQDLPTVLEPFMDDMAGSTMLAHNAGFDIAVLCGTLALYGRPLPRLTYLCTKAVARKAWPAHPRFGLAALSAKIGVTFRHHHAGEDAYACARIALAAAETVGMSRISLLADRLGLRPGSVDGPLRSPCMSAGPTRPRVARHRLAERPTRRAAGHLAFSVRGSRGSPYDIVGSFDRDGYALRCSCMAGRHKLRCRHVTSLLDGEVTDLASTNLHDIEKLRTIVQALGEDLISPPADRPRRAAA